METSIFAVAALGAVALVLLVVGQAVYLACVVSWADRRTAGMAYCGAPAAERRRFKRRLAWHAWALSPLLNWFALQKRFRFRDATFCYRGVPGPAAGSCSPETFEAATLYEPRADDVFVVTQMRSGTTWMQHLVFQLLSRGERDLAAEQTTLNAISPWLESNRTVGVADAPLVGQSPCARIIKTHLPASLCPFDARAKYVYVVRSPTGCFASCVDFVRNNAGRFRVSLEDALEWFTSDDLMWWGDWVEHVVGWRDRAAESDNVLVVRFEDMQSDLPGVAARVAGFLGIADLDDAALARCVARCGFDYMKRNEDVFEMHPPHLLQRPGGFLVSGVAKRHEAVPAALRERLLAGRRAELARRGRSLADLYPELAFDA
ncbi:sulfotransferase domain-containing protein [Botrimarina sp.]|uniref:sulfotransferase domain-containing protein n=1 Tax=Botrimarina sp. TaxID=2795802 RepID=UPI0032EBC885